MGHNGIGAAATVVTDIRRTSPSAQLLLLVYIVDDVPSDTNNIRPGDVALGMQLKTHGGVVQYNLSKETTKGFERNGHPPNFEYHELNTGLVNS